MQTAKFCIYCFWKPQKQFDSVKGVLKTEVGYIGGNKENITYEECCTGETNACEAIILEFDENNLSRPSLSQEFDSQTTQKLEDSKELNIEEGSEDPPGGKDEKPGKDDEDIVDADFEEVKKSDK